MSTRPSNAEIKKALMIAYNNISCDDYEFICSALPIGEAGEYVRKFIMQAIQPEITLNKWVFECNRKEMYPSDEDMKVYRLRWIDYMLEGLE